jgi:hypothetical protein
MNRSIRLARIHIKLIIAALLVLVLFVRGCGSCSNGLDEWRHVFAPADTIAEHSRHVDKLLSSPRRAVPLTNPDGSPVKNRVGRIDDYSETFPDMNDVQYATASRLGIDCIEDREEAQQRKDDLVYITDSPFYHVQHLSHSIPYLVPRAQRLLNEISRTFIDSLQRKGYPFYKVIVTSVLRTRHDVRRLRRVNGNASENSCHQFGTTFDICYNSFYRVIDPDDATQRQVWDGRLKEVLAEVLRDQRLLGTCYVRYEARQACFHITAR